MKEIPKSQRVWLPLSKILVRSQNDRAAILAANGEMNPVETLLFAIFFYSVTLVFLGICTLPGLAILPFGRWLGWPILLILHMALLHGALIFFAKLADLLQLDRLKINRLAWQTGCVLVSTTALAAWMLCFAGAGRVAGIVWLTFCLLNLLVWPFTWRQQPRKQP